MTPKQYDELYLLCSDLYMQNKTLTEKVQSLCEEVAELKSKVNTHYELNKAFEQIKVDVQCIKDEMEV